MRFSEIFEEYFSHYRGQATNLPTAGDPEWELALQFANTAIRKWDRADGVEWKELWKNYAENEETVSTGTAEYEIPDMRKPPKQINFRGTDRFTSRPVISAAEADMYGDTQGLAYFTGSANRGFTLNLTGDLSTLDGLTLDFIYIKKPTMITNGDSKPDMSDPNFMIQDMLASRFANSRNGFGVKLAKSEALTALQNMKIDNNTGTYGNSDNLGRSGSGWGVANQHTDIRL